MLTDYLIVQGIISGLAISMPMGAIGMLFLRYTLVQGKYSGLAAGCGIATADFIAAFLGSISLSLVTAFTNEHEVWVRYVGSLMLIFFGFYLLLKGNKKKQNKIEQGFFHIFLIMFIITVTNPLTILSITGVFAALGVDNLEHEPLSVLLLSLGVFIGSLAWWVSLLFVSLFFKINETSVRHMNAISGAFLLLIGLVSLYATYTAL